MGDFKAIVVVYILGDRAFGLLLFWFLVEFRVVEKDHLQELRGLLTNRLILLLDNFLFFLLFVTPCILSWIRIIDQSLDLFSHLLFVILNLYEIDVDLKSLRYIVLFFEV